MVENGITAEPLYWPLEDQKPNILTYLQEGKIDLVVNIPKNNQQEELKNDYLIRCMAVDLEIPLITNIKIARQVADALDYLQKKKLEIKAWDEY